MNDEMVMNITGLTLITISLLRLKAPTLSYFWL